MISEAESLSDYFGSTNERDRGDVAHAPGHFSPISKSPGKSDRRTSKSPRPFSPLDSKRIANIVVARNLNRANPQVQIQALEVHRPPFLLEHN